MLDGAQQFKLTEITKVFDRPRKDSVMLRCIDS